jgi:hypothetical protein
MRVRQLLVIELPTEIGDNRLACSGKERTHVAPFHLIESASSDQAHIVKGHAVRWSRRSPTAEANAHAHTVWQPIFRSGVPLSEIAGADSRQRSAPSQRLALSENRAPACILPRWLRELLRCLAWLDYF